jgi:hypothetical protein
MFQATGSSRHGHTGPDAWEPPQRVSVMGAPLSKRFTVAATDMRGRGTPTPRRENIPGKSRQTFPG